MIDNLTSFLNIQDKVKQVFGKSLFNRYINVGRVLILKASFISTVTLLICNSLISQRCTMCLRKTISCKPDYD